MHVHTRDYRDITDLKLNTRAFAATYRAYWSGEHGNLKNEHRSRKISLHSYKVPLAKFIIIRLRAPLIAGNKNAESNLCG